MVSPGATGGALNDLASAALGGDVNVERLLVGASDNSAFKKPQDKTGMLLESLKSNESVAPIANHAPSAPALNQ